MYSPKIKEDLIPKLYEIAKKRVVPMTELVDNIIREALENGYQVRKEANSSESEEDKDQVGQLSGDKSQSRNDGYSQALWTSQ